MSYPPISLDESIEQWLSYGNSLVDLPASDGMAERIKADLHQAYRHFAERQYNEALSLCSTMLYLSYQFVLIEWQSRCHQLMAKIHIEAGRKDEGKIRLAIKHLEAAKASLADNEYEWYIADHELRTAQCTLSQILEEHMMTSVWGPCKNDQDDNLCFVMMPFVDPAVDGVYKQIIVPAVEENGLVPERADSFKASTSVMHDVWTYITRARVLIADLTSFNANVYYELGLCHALNKTPILMIQKGHDLPFDLRSFRTIFYSTSLKDIPEVKQTLSEYIAAALNAP
jgi:hypothetical protein